MSRRKQAQIRPEEQPQPGEEGLEVAAGQPDEKAALEKQAEETPADPIERLETELAQSADRVLRMQAEMENLRNRTSREINDVRRYASMPLLRDLLPVVDNIERAIRAAENTNDAESLIEGFRMVAGQLDSVLAQHNCTLIDALGQPFDPNLHEAISQQPSDEHPAGTVILVTQTGYQLHDRVVRPSQVIVSTEPPEA